MMRTTVSTILAGLLAGTGALAETATSFEGEWCHPEWGTALFWDAHGIGLGEHGICEWSAAPGDELAYQTELSCANMVPDGQGGWQPVNQRTHAFRAVQLGDGTLEVQFDDDIPIVMTRCDS